LRRNFFKSFSSQKEKSFISAFSLIFLYIFVLLSGLLTEKTRIFSTGIFSRIARKKFSKLINSSPFPLICEIKLAVKG